MWSMASQPWDVEGLGDPQPRQGRHQEVQLARNMARALPVSDPRPDVAPCGTLKRSLWLNTFPRRARHGLQDVATRQGGLAFWIMSVIY